MRCTVLQQHAACVQHLTRLLMRPNAGGGGGGGGRLRGRGRGKGKGKMVKGGLVFCVVLPLFCFICNLGRFFCNFLDGHRLMKFG